LASSACQPCKRLGGQGDLAAGYDLLSASAASSVRWVHGKLAVRALCDLIEGVESVNAEFDPTYPELDRK